MTDDLVVIHDSEPRAGTYLIAQGFERNHKAVLNLIYKYKKDFEELGVLKRKNYKHAGAGRPIEEYLLNEQQSMFLGTLLRNSEKTVAFKLRLVKKFLEVANKLRLAEEKLKQKPDLLSAREFGKSIRKLECGGIDKFAEYAKSQGSQNSKKYFMAITKMMNGLLFIVEGKFKNLREVMTPHQLMTVSTVETIIIKGLEDGMRNKMYYKDIFQDIKSRVRQFADLHGQMHIIDDLLLENEDPKRMVTK